MDYKRKQYIYIALTSKGLIYKFLSDGRRVRLQHATHGSRMILGQTELLNLLPKTGFTAAVAGCIGEHVVNACNGCFAIICDCRCERSDCSFLQ